MTNLRMRMAAAAGTMALTASLALSPAVMAQDAPMGTPVDAMQTCLNAIVEKDFETASNCFCAAEADQAAEFDLDALSAEIEGMDAQQLLDAFIITWDPDEENFDLISESETEAFVRVVGTMTMDLDQQKLMPFVESVIEMAGMEADEDTVEMFMTIVASEFDASSEDVDVEVRLVLEDGAWKICSDLAFGGADLVGGGEDDSMSDDSMSDDDMSDDDTFEESDDMSDDDTSDDDMDDDDDMDEDDDSE